MSKMIKAGKVGAVTGMSAYDVMGDPGLFGDIFGGIKKGLGFATGLVGSVLPGPIGGLAKGISGILGGRPRGVAPAPGVGMPIPQMQIGTRPPPWSFGSFPAATGQQNGRAFPATADTGGPPGTGYHLNKSGYYRRSPAGSIVYVPPRSVWVRNRRRNPLNPRALDRALGRVSSAKNASKRLSGVTIRKKCACK